MPLMNPVGKHQGHLQYRHCHHQGQNYYQYHPDLCPHRSSGISSNPQHRHYHHQDRRYCQYHPNQCQPILTHSGEARPEHPQHRHYRQGQNYYQYHPDLYLTLQLHPVGRHPEYPQHRHCHHQGRRYYQYHPNQYQPILTHLDDLSILMPHYHHRDRHYYHPDPYLTLQRRSSPIPSLSSSGSALLPIPSESTDSDPFRGAS